MAIYDVTLRRTKTVNVLRQRGNLRTYQLSTSKSPDEARAYVQAIDCDHNRPWEIVSIVRLWPDADQKAELIAT